MVRPETFLPRPINFGDSLKIVILGLMGLSSVAAVTHLKADNPLYGSSYVDDVRCACVMMLIVRYA